ncbi:MAG: hypothetical protein LBU48_07800 [Coriobacteriales bacterium]|nr:hypothetical protein [Coriobacteriales bacterium]
MSAQKPKVSPAEKRFNYVVVIFAKLAALVLSVLALSGYTIRSFSTESVIGLLTTAIVLLVLAGIQDSTTIMRELKELSAQKALNDQLINNIQSNVANIKLHAEKIEHLEQ